MTIQELKKRVDLLKYLGFDESKRMWVYAYQDIYHKIRIYGLMAGNVIELRSLNGLNLKKE